MRRSTRQSNENSVNPPWRARQSHATTVSSTYRRRSTSGGIRPLSVNFARNFRKSASSAESVGHGHVAIATGTSGRVPTPGQVSQFGRPPAEGVKKGAAGHLADAKGFMKPLAGFGCRKVNAMRKYLADRSVLAAVLAQECDRVRAANRSRGHQA